MVVVHHGGMIRSTLNDRKRKKERDKKAFDFLFTNTEIRDVKSERFGLDFG